GTSVSLLCPYSELSDVPKVMTRRVRGCQRKDVTFPWLMGQDRAKAVSSQILARVRWPRLITSIGSYRLGQILSGKPSAQTKTPTEKRTSAAAKATVSSNRNCAPAEADISVKTASERTRPSGSIITPNKHTAAAITASGTT